jgi:hypothetical protein
MEAGDLLILTVCPMEFGQISVVIKVRIAQYISMMPAEEENDALRDWRINSWKTASLLRVMPSR